jgi:hypothetical protein
MFLQAKEVSGSRISKIVRGQILRMKTVDDASPHCSFSELSTPAPTGGAELTGLAGARIILPPINTLLPEKFHVKHYTAFYM